jgi:serine/threonine protein kinase
MSIRFTVEHIHAELPIFARHHKLDMTASGDVLMTDETTGDGGFGDVHPVLSINDRPPTRPVLVKLFIGNAMQDVEEQEVIGSVRNLHDVLNDRRDRNWLNALLALPFSIFNVDFDGKSQLALLMLDLAPLGYKQAPAPEQAQQKSYIKATTTGERVDLALRYAERAALLEQISFIHGDQNPENLMVNLTTGDIQIIDFDTGAVVIHGGERPLTNGKKDGFVPPEVKPAGPGGQLPVAEYTLEAERWSVGGLVGLIIFGKHPAYFLRSISSKALDDYARAGYSWPDIDPDGPLFVNPKSRRSYENFKLALQSVPPTIIDLFGKLFAAGSVGRQRPTAAEWVEAINDGRQPPAFSSIDVFPNFVLEGSEVVAIWSVDNAEHVDCPQLGNLEPSGKAETTLYTSTKLTFTASNHWGSTTEHSPLVRVVQLPQIRTIPIPEFPGLELQTVIPMPPFPAAEENPFPVAPSLGRLASTNLNRSAMGPQIPTLPQIPDIFASELGPIWPTMPRSRTAGKGGGLR